MGYYQSQYGGFPPYVPVAERRRRAAREIASLHKKGKPTAPVIIPGRAIATTFWGRAWCDNLESYSDYANRLPRGRTYVRNGSVLDLSIQAGEVSALVMGSQLYRVHVSISPIGRAQWQALIKECAGRIDSLVELLRGRLSRGVMEIITRKGSGLFPSPRELELSCSCPDSAVLCKHVAAALYGVGARLDEQPGLLFTLRQVEQLELITRASAAHTLSRGVASTKHEALAGADLSELFGIELDPGAAADSAKEPAPAARKAPAGRRAAASPAKELAPAPAPAAPKAPSARRAAASTAKELAPAVPKTPSARRAAASPAKELAPAVPKTPSARRAAGDRARARPAAARPRPKIRAKMTRKELLAGGIAASLLQLWLRIGLLLPSGERGIYRTTAPVRRQLAALLSG